MERRRREGALTRRNYWAKKRDLGGISAPRKNDELRRGFQRGTARCRRQRHRPLHICQAYCVLALGRTTRSRVLVGVGTPRFPCLTRSGGRQVQGPAGSRLTTPQIICTSELPGMMANSSLAAHSMTLPSPGNSGLEGPLGPLVKNTENTLPRQWPFDRLVSLGKAR